MRYYLIDQEKDELVIDLQLIKKHDNNLFEFQLCFLENNVIENTQLVYTRKLAGQYFVSLNLSSWEKVSPQVFPRIFWIEEEFMIYIEGSNQVVWVKWMRAN